MRPIPWLAGYENFAPVRIGNGASEQLQIDVFGDWLTPYFKLEMPAWRPQSEAEPYARRFPSSVVRKIDAASRSIKTPEIELSFRPTRP